MRIDDEREAQEAEDEKFFDALGIPKARIPHWTEIVYPGTDRLRIPLPKRYQKPDAG